MRQIAATLTTTAALCLVAAQALLFDATGSDASWDLPYPDCAASAAGVNTAFLRSPTTVPTDSAASAAPFVTSISQVGRAGQRLLVPIDTVANVGGVVQASLAFVGTTVVVNGTTLRPLRVLLRRPPEHRPPGVSDPTRTVEQQIFFGTGNSTELIASSFFSDAGAANTVVNPSEVDASFIEGAANALRAGSAAVHLDAGMWNFGLTPARQWHYQGTQTFPPCTRVNWLVDPSVKRTTTAVVNAIPTSNGRAVKPPSGDVTAVSSWVDVSLSSVLEGPKKVHVNSSARRVHEMTFAFPDFATARDNLLERVLLQCAVYMLVALCIVALGAIIAALVLRMLYRPQERSTWVNAKTGAQYFGFGPSTLYVQELDADDTEDMTDDEEEEEDED